MRLEDIKKYIAPTIIDVAQIPLLKEACVYQLLAPKLHILVIGDPAAGAKTSIADSLRMIYGDGFAFFTNKATGPGLRDKMLSLKKHDFSVAIFDEFPNASKELKDMMLDILQRQTITINLSDKYGGSSEHRIPSNIYATANPIGSKWKVYGDIDLMKRQLPLNVAELRRFHLYICTRNYDMHEYRDVKDGFFSKDKETDFNQFYKDHMQEYEDLKEEIMDMRDIKVSVELNETASKFLDNLKKFENDLVFPITVEVFAGFKNLTTAICRLDKADEAKDKHLNAAVDFSIKAMLTNGLLDEHNRMTVKGIEMLKQKFLG